MSVIYKVTNIKNGKIYVGMSKYDNLEYLGSGIKIVNAVKLYGKEFFERTVIEECNNSIASEREKYWIDYFNSTDNEIGYNISQGGEGGDHYWATLTEEQKKLHNQKISDSVKKRTRKPHTTHTKQKMSENYNRDPDVIKARAAGKRKTYFCIDHKTNKVYKTNDLIEFCSLHGINYKSMRHQSRVKRNYCHKHWTCRIYEEYKNVENILDYVNNEIHKSQKEAKRKTGLSKEQQSRLL